MAILRVRRSILLIRELPDSFDHHGIEVYSMKRSLSLLVTASTAAATMLAVTIQMDSGRGQHVFESESCIQCHAIGGKGGRIAPDLARAIDRNFTPATLASTMWNHAPSMWSTMAKQNVARAGLDEQAAADLFAYFYSARFFEKPGDAARGKRLFHERTCDQCHGISNSPNPASPPVVKWSALGDPIELTRSEERRVGKECRSRWS